jgi:transposase
MSKRPRRSFSREYKAEVVALIRKSGKSPELIATELGLTATAVRRWFSEAEAGASGANSGQLGQNEREELRRLRKENLRLQMERDFLKKAAAFFAKESK